MQHLWEWPKEESTEHRPQSRDRSGKGLALLSLQSQVTRARARVSGAASEGSGVPDEPPSGHVELELALDEIEIIYQVLESLISQLKAQGIEIE